MLSMFSPPSSVKCMLLFRERLMGKFLSAARAYTAAGVIVGAGECGHAGRKQRQIGVVASIPAENHHLSRRNHNRDSCLDVADLLLVNVSVAPSMAAPWESETTPKTAAVYRVCRTRIRPAANPSWLLFARRDRRPTLRTWNRSRRRRNSQGTCTLHNARWPHRISTSTDGKESPHEGRRMESSRATCRSRSATVWE
jgi:hypothetical protein